MPFAPRASRSSARRAPRRSSKARRTSPRRSWRGTASRRRQYRDVHRRRARRTPTSTRAARRSSSRPTASPPARAWSSRRRATEAHAAIDAMLVDNAMGDAGARVVIEDFLAGEEASFIVMVDGRHVLPLASSQDHKRLRDGDRGPEHRRHGRVLAGAGRHAGAARADHARGDRARPSSGMAADGIPYTGFLYAGVMIDAAGKPQRARIQLPPGRSGDAADHGAAQVRSRRSRRSTRSTARSTTSRRSGTGAPRSASCSRRPAIRTRRARATSIDGLDRVDDADASRTCTVFHAGTALARTTRRRQRRPRAVRDGARRLGAAGAARRVRRGRRASTSTACSTAPTSAIARSRARMTRRPASAPPMAPSRWTSPRVRALLRRPAGSASSRGSRRSTAATFRRDEWTRPEGGGGISRLIEDGRVLERGGVLFSHVTGDQPAAVGDARSGPSSPAARGRRWACRSCCIRAIPTRRRCISTCAISSRARPGADPLWWFGGGMDLTPYYGFAEDAVHFHRTCRDALAPFGDDVHAALQAVVRRLLLPEAPQRAARHRRHLLRRSRTTAASSAASR